MTVDLKHGAERAIESISDELVDLSHRIHATPELMFEETLASTWTADLLDRQGFAVEDGICDLPTAFRATAGQGPLHIAFCAEYDALPDIGHACGHNLIAASSVGAAVGLAQVADEIGVTVTVLGTPAEEGGGGKILMLERGAFDGVHAALMVHPAPVDLVDMPSLAYERLHVAYHGRSSHAASFPELGVNAANAIVIAQTAIGLLRQHLGRTDRVHGIVTNGGQAENIVPELTEGIWAVRAATLGELQEVRAKLVHCFEAGALATGCELELNSAGPAYAELRTDSDIAKAYRVNAEARGRSFPDIPADLLAQAAASTDMGNVSLAIPSIHPTIGLESFPAVPHMPEFAGHCVTPAADRALIDAAVALAWTGIDIATLPLLRSRVAMPKTAGS